MSTLILPGSEDFKSTLANLAGKKPASSPLSSRAKKVVDLVGHTLMLNTALAKTFQCGGFALGPNRPLDVVTEQAQQEPLRRALAEHKLIDVTGKDMATKGFKAKGGQTSAISEEETEAKVFLGRDRRGNLYIATPKSKTEAKRMEREIRATGTLKGRDYEAERTGLSPITEEEIESTEPAPKPKTRKTKKVNKRGRSSSRSSNAKQ